MELATLCVLLLGLAFAFFNGFHDAGITVGNIVATHGLSPRVALALATGFNFVGALLGQGIATVVATEVASFPHSSNQLLAVLGGGIAGALLVNVVTYFMAVPIASTHVLMGGLVGAWLVVGWEDRPSIMFDETIISIFIMPFLALFASIVLTRVVFRVVASYPPKPLFKRCRQVNSVMVAGLSLAHGSQDAQKIGAVMGLVWVSGVHPGAEVVMDGRPWTLIVLTAVALAAGTWFSGWRVARTVSVSMVRLDPVTSVISNTTSAVFLSLAAFVFRLPASMSFVVVASNLGTARRRQDIRLRPLMKVVAAWILGIPVASCVAALFTLPLLMLT